jgi:hypothetical protein
MEIWIKPDNNDESEAAGTAQIRTVKTQKIIGTFDWSGFGVKVVAPEPPFTVLWRPDNRYFAIGWEKTRGWVTGAIYGKNKAGKWEEVKLPSDEYDAAIKKMAGIADLYGKGCEKPKEWLQNGDLVLQFFDRNLGFHDGDSEQEYLITLQIEDTKGQPLRIARIASIVALSEAESMKDW